jgi:hypothetical protein
MSETQALAFLNQLAAPSTRPAPTAENNEDFLASLTTPVNNPAQRQIDELISKAESYYLGIETGVEDYRTAAKLYAQAAELGSSEAHLKLADIFAEGEGLPMDKPKALEHMKSAARLGDANAYSAMAFFFTQTSDYESALQCWDRFFTIANEGRSTSLRKESLAICLAAYPQLALSEGWDIKHHSLLALQRPAILNHLGEQEARMKELGSDWLSQRHAPIKSFLQSVR